MSLRAKKAFDEWKEADAAARLAEMELETAWKKYFLRESPAPIESLMTEVGRRRRLADERLRLAIQVVADTKRGIDETFAPGSGLVYRPPGRADPDRHA